MATATTPTRSARLGASFRAARNGAGLSVRQVAGRVGISHTSVSLWERGQRDLAEDTYQALTDALADYLAGKWQVAA